MKHARRARTVAWFLVTLPALVALDMTVMTYRNWKQWHRGKES